MQVYISVFYEDQITLNRFVIEGLGCQLQRFAHLDGRCERSCRLPSETKLFTAVFTLQLEVL